MQKIDDSSLLLEKSPITLNCRGRLISLQKPIIMGILNLTPDSFSDGGNYLLPDKALMHVEKMLQEGASIIDIGGYSSRPGATHISEEEELKRVLPITEKIRLQFPEAILSVDTFRLRVAKEMLSMGVHIINDIYAGRYEEGLFELAAQLRAPYIVMHMQGTPQTMQQTTYYQDLLEEIRTFLIERIQAARQKGVMDVIIDPGFGFGKSINHNYTLLKNLRLFASLGCPLLVGISRKSFMWKVLGVSPTQTLAPTSALHLQALLQGAKILRVHDVKEAAQIITIYEQWQVN
ncbi:MAG: dihydropteroate synthase [Bacteroidia bacterium]|nr:dihydropteroate synthase [Bacteroidia bacterium]MDW8157529.1 dihydropteroate synthase [Bacteroidia bacterium]